MRRAISCCSWSALSARHSATRFLAMNSTTRSWAAAEPDTISGGAGSDTADYSTSSAGVLVALGNSTGDFAVAVARDNNIADGNDDSDAAGDQLTGIENLIGSAFATASMAIA